VNNDQTSSDQFGDQASANLRAMGLMVLGMGSFVVNDTLMKTTSSELPLGEIIAIRGVMCCLSMAPIVAMTSGLGTIARIYTLPVLIRNVAEVGAVFTFLTALFRLPIADVSGVLQAVPLAITAAAAIILREPVGWRRWSAALVGFVGVMMIIRPGTSEFSVWYFFALTTVAFVVVRDMSTRFIPRTSPSFAITFITAIVVTLAGCVLGAFETWVAPTFATLVRLFAAAILVLIGYWSLIEAMRTAEISAVAPFRYTVVLWAMLLGYLVFGEVPSAWTIAGSAVVVSAGLYTLHRERIVARRHAAARSATSVIR